jgi:hypothetical protein
MNQYVFSVLTIVSLTTLASGQTAQDIRVKIIDDLGAPLPNADVVVVLKSGAYQEAKFDNREYKCEPTERSVRIFTAAPGFEAAVKRHAGTEGVISITLKPSATKSSTIIRGGGSLPGIDGSVNPILDKWGRTYMYGSKIGFEHNRRPALQPVAFSLNSPIDAMTSTGKRFKIWVVDITQEVSVLEFTQPK